jgi:hypothetical protein
MLILSTATQNEVDYRSHLRPMSLAIGTMRPTLLITATIIRPVIIPLLGTVILCLHRLCRTTRTVLRQAMATHLITRSILPPVLGQSPTLDR